MKPLFLLLWTWAMLPVVPCAWAQQQIMSENISEKMPPLQQSVSLRSFCPPPADQGVLPASAAHALCNALSIQRQIQRQAGIYFLQLNTEGRLWATGRVAVAE